MEEKESIFNERAQNVAKKVKDYFNSTRRSVGGQIRETEYGLWEDYRQRCKDYKLQMNPEGTEHILRLSNKIDDVFFPIAKASGLDPAKFTEERIDILLKSVKGNKDWIDDTDKLHDAVIDKTDRKLTIHSL